MKVAGWRAFYTEGRVFDSATIAWAGLPDDGVLVVVVYLDENGADGLPLRQLNSGTAWYFEFKSELDVAYLGNNAPREENEIRYPGCILKRGKGVDLATMDIVEKLAMEAKTAPITGG